MAYTSVILNCPDALYLWFEERLGNGTVQKSMLAALQTFAQTPVAQECVVITTPLGTTRLGNIFGEMLSPLPEPPSALPPQEHDRVPPVVPKVTGAKYRKKNQRRRYAQPKRKS